MENKEYLPFGVGHIRAYKVYSNLPNHDLNYVPFMNHGFSDDSIHLELTENEKVFKYMYQMYAHLIENFNIDTRDKKLLDIGCGYGKGVDFLKRYYSFNEAYGLDIYAFHILNAERLFKNVNFLTFDARHLKLLNLKFDVIISVESLCHYPYCDSYYSGLYNILNDSGDAIITLITDNLTLPAIKQKFEENNFKIVNFKDVTNNVIQGCRLQLNILEEQFKLENVKGPRSKFEHDVLINALNMYENKVCNYSTFHLRKNV